MSKIWQFIKEHPCKSMAALIIIIILIWTYGCTPKTTSVISPPRRVDKYELKAEMELVITQFESKFDNIHQQEELRNALFAAAAQMYSAGTVDPLGIAITLAGILGIGAAGDDVRLRRRIKRTGGTPPTV